MQIRTLFWGAALTPALVLAETESHRLPAVDIIGSSADAFSLSGSAYVLSNEDLEKKEYTDVHRMLQDAPGVYLQEEDGYGLRPNIGIRGAASGRSERVSLMEDGVLMAPAPYAAPAAYYFPSAGRFHGIEVLKGPDTLRYGPFTVGGAINFLSTPIPDSPAGMVQLETGENGHQRGHAWYGATHGQWGFLLETHQQSSDGFKDVDRSDRDTGFDKRDYIAKLRWTSPAEASLRQALELKLSHSSEVSNETYLGLSDGDFHDDPNRRYGLSALDQMDNDHDGIALRHHLVLGDRTQLESVIYRNEFQRDWFKVSGAGGRGLGGLIDDANGGDADARAILDGSQDVSDVTVKHNNREYTAKGVQSELAHAFTTAALEHEMVVGARFHQDEVDRYQPVEVFSQTNGVLVPSGYVAPTGGDNRVEEADAWSAWLVDKIYIGKLILTGSLRYEDIQSKARRYGDPGRDTVSRRDSNDVSEVLAGLGATYLLSDQWSLLAGVHQGFAPAGASATDGTDPEKSVNYEAGARYWGERVNVDVIGFYSDYENTLQNCSLAYPCDLAGGGSQDSGSMSFGESRVYGLELAAGSTLWRAANGLTVPLRLAYTYTRGKVTRSSESSDAAVESGDRLPYLPEHQASLTVGLEQPAQWGGYLTTRYVEGMCVTGACDSGLERTDDLLVVDLTASYYLTSAVEVYGKVDNLFDEQKIVARSPDGARPNLPRTAALGIRAHF
ncbi:TonB-dependent receptor family protein [Alloalcanivorax xenomutans]|uniref:TonB-dependent receptor family protein n=1 Tax=Alloalcanivorax xenomutans TaxID=1094342 RepID=UPI003D9B9893